MCKLYQADFSQDRQHIRELFTELLQLLNDNIVQKFGVGFDFEARVANYMAQLQVFSPPNGRLVLAVVDSEVAGVGCIMTTGERMGEVKHMYVRPQFRRRGLGRKLLGNLVEQSVTMGHTVLRLDSAWFMEAAHALYRSFGFREIAPYPESEVPKEMHDFWIFMEKDLISSTDAIGPSPAQLQRDPR